MDPVNPPVINPATTTDEQFNAALQTWLTAVQAKINAYFAANYTNLKPSVLELVHGDRYVRVISHDVSVSGIVSKSGSAFAFIDKTGGKIGKSLNHKRGDILKPASFRVPSPHSRGNIFNPDNGLSKVGVYGPDYLR